MSETLLILNVSLELFEECGSFCLFASLRGHEWNVTLEIIKIKIHGALLVQDVIFYIEIAKKIAIKRDGLCLSNQCKATKEILQWKCSKSYEWSATYNNEKIDV
ncbi:hypothetical protein RhiirA4_477233 [Rhizophagus irregularis]|uniref:Uncharacterized protein n=1 Tax=Rhizophagus irregularis TaxID=588596 RepID=A0A2I1HCW6_9GLOM|nr:hypothetical protein RhiirA4_477233 [Rhizophagus irregularis]